MYLDRSHTIEIEAKGLLVRMSNDVQPVLLKLLLRCIKRAVMLADISSVDAICYHVVEGQGMHVH